MLARLARWCVRRRKIVVFGFWLPLLIVINVAGGSIGSDFNTSFTLPESESAEVIDIFERINPDLAGFTGQVVVQASQGIDDPAITEAITGLLADIDDIEGVSVDSPYDDPTKINDDGTIGYAELDISDRGQTEILELSKEIQALDDSLVEGAGAIDGLRIEYGGDVFAEFELPAAEALGLIAAVIILIVAFGSVLAMGLPIGTALFGLGIGTAIVTFLSHLISMPDFTAQVVAMIGLGVGIDYALFIVTRYREGLIAGMSVEDAVVASVDTSGRAVLFAGGTVLISLCGLFLMGVSFVNGLAVGSLVGVMMMMFASVTLLPALLGMVGRKIDVTTRAALASTVVFVIGALAAVITTSFMPLLAGMGLAVIVYLSRLVYAPMGVALRHREPKAPNQTFWYKWSRFIQRRPWPVLVASAGFLIILAIPLFSIRLGFGDAGNYAEKQTARQAYDLMADGFGPGQSAPILVVAQGDDARNTEALAALTTTLGETPGVAFVTPAAPLGPDVSMITVIPASAQQDEATSDLVHRLRDDVIPNSGVEALVGGQTAGGIDFASYLSGRLVLLIGAVLVLSFLLLATVFRSVLVPLKAVALNLLSIGAAYGVLVAIFQWGWGNELIGAGREGPIEAWVPMMLFAIVFGLSMDYEVFLLSRIKEKYDETHNNGVAVADGLAATARVITAAALIMVAVFSAFALGDERALKLFGIGMGVAVFVDATVVRMLLVPATMELLGDRNWWIPKWLDRILPRVDVEGPHRDATAAPDDAVGADQRA